MESKDYLCWDIDRYEDDDAKTFNCLSASDAAEEAAEWPSAQEVWVGSPNGTVQKFEVFIEYSPNYSAVKKD